MGNPITSADFTRLVDNNLYSITESETKYADLNSFIPRLFSVKSSEKAYEEFLDIGAVPDIPRHNGRIRTLSVAPGYYKKIEPAEWSGALQIERKFMDDKKYGVFGNTGKSLIRSALRTKEKTGVNLLANGFSAAFDFQTSEEGKALCSSSHTTKSGTSTASGFSNAGSTALSKTSAAATRLLMKQFRNDISERIEMDDNFELWVPDNLAETAFELNNTKSGLDTAEGNANFHYQRYTIVVYPRLDDYDSNNWFMMNAQMRKDAFIWINRINPEINRDTDAKTLMTWISVYFRAAYGFIDWRPIYGHNVS